MHPESGSYTRRGILAATGLAAVVGLATPVAARPPKKALPPKKPPAVPPNTGPVVRRIDLLSATIGRIQQRILDSGDADTDVLGVVLEHSFVRGIAVKNARDAVVEGDSKTARTTLLTVRGIVEGDIALLEDVDDRGTVGDVLGLERSLLNQTDSALDAVDRLGVMPGDNVS